MKKFLSIVFFSILIFSSAHVFASQFEIHGDITKSLSLSDFKDNTDIWSTILSGKYSLELSLSGNNDNVIKAGVKNIGNDVNLNYTRNQSYYVDYSSSAFSLWFAMGLNDDYPVYNLNDPMGIGNLEAILKHTPPEIEWDDDFKNNMLYWYKNYNSTGIIPRFQIGTNLNVGRFSLNGSFGQYYVYSDASFSTYLMDFALSDPLSAGIYRNPIFENQFCEDNILNVLMLRGKLELHKYINLGLSFVSYIGTGDCSPGGFSQLALDLTGDTPYIGGNYVLALLGTMVSDDACGGADTSIFAESGFGAYVALENIPIGKAHQFKLGFDLAVQPSTFPLCIKYGSLDLNEMKELYMTSAIPSINFMYETLRIGAKLKTTVDLEEFGYIDFTLRDYVYADLGNMDIEFKHNILSLESELYTPSGSYVNLLAYMNNDLAFQETTFSLALDADIVVTENFTINSKAWVDNSFYNPYYSVQLGAIGNWDLPTNEHVSAADYTLGVMAGLTNNDSSASVDEPVFLTLAYMEINSKFTNNLGLRLAAYVDNNFGTYSAAKGSMEYESPSLTHQDIPVTFVASATLEYWLTDKLAISATGTYRNWVNKADDPDGFDVSYSENSSGIVGSKALSLHEFTVKDNFFAMLALTYNFCENSSVQLAWGRDGLADKEVTDAKKYSNATVYPWMKLATAPRYGEMDWKAIKITVSFKF